MPSSKTPKKTAKASVESAKSTASKPVVKSKTSALSVKSSVDFTAPAAAKKSADAAPKQSAKSSEAAAPLKGEGKTHQVPHHEIAKLAHDLWVARGHRHGSAEQDWLHAEQQLKASAAKA